MYIRSLTKLQSHLFTALKEQHDVAKKNLPWPGSNNKTIFQSTPWWKIISKESTAPPRCGAHDRCVWTELKHHNSYKVRTTYLMYMQASCLFDNLLYFKLEGGEGYHCGLAVILQEGGRWPAYPHDNRLSTRSKMPQMPCTGLLVWVPLSLSYPEVSVILSLFKLQNKWFFILYRRPFHFTPLHEGSPYDAVKLGSLLLAVLGAFVLPRQQLLQPGDFTIRDYAKLWLVICQVDHSTDKYA